ncbi:MAG: sulfotransferase family 2 domain-containing protein [Pseudomonadota bacterium]
MPVFYRNKGPKVLFVHIPKTGGTYLSDLFMANGYERYFWHGRPASIGCFVSPQHLHREVYETVFNVAAFDWTFVTVRHPLDRLLSEFRSRNSKNGVAFGDWMTRVERRFHIDRSFQDNHFRPQVDFLTDGLEILRNEVDYDQSWAEGVSKSQGLGFETFEVTRRRNTRVTSTYTLTSADLDRAATFCREAYAADFERLNYSLEDAQVFAKA